MVVEKSKYEEFLELSSDEDSLIRYEYIFGKIYAMAGASADHQDILGNIFFKIKQFQNQETDEKKKCFPRVAPYDVKVYCKDEINVVQPDIMIFCEDKEIPCAVFEILSPSTAHKDKSVKRELYECIGVKEYFLVDTEAKTIDKFILEDKSYKYDNCYGHEDNLFINCLEKEVELEEIFSLS